jgi:hypothetical protein
MKPKNVNQRERGEIGYQPKPKIETPKNAKDLANLLKMQINQLHSASYLTTLKHHSNRC